MDSHVQRSPAKRRRRRPEGCSTCGTRRVKCGKEKPSCHQCIKSGRICGGYRYSGVQGSPKLDTLQSTELAQVPSEPAEHPLLLSIGFQNELKACAEYLAANAGDLLPYCHHLPKQVGHDLALNFAILSVGNMLRDVHKRIRYNPNTTAQYGIAIFCLREALKDPKRQVKAEILCAASLLCVFGCLEGDTDAAAGYAWLACHLIQRRGLGGFASDFEKSLLTSQVPMLSHTLSSGGIHFNDAEWSCILQSFKELPLPNRDQRDVALEFYLLETPLGSLLTLGNSLMPNLAPRCRNVDLSSLGLPDETTKNFRHVLYWTQRVKEFCPVPINDGSPDHKSTYDAK